MTDEKTMLGARVPEDLKRFVDTDPRNNQEVVEAALWNEFGGRRRGALERRLEHKEQRIAQTQREIEELEQELQILQQERDALQEKLDVVDEATDAYLNDLDAVLDGLEDGGLARVFDEHGRVQELADDHDRTPTALMDDLKERAVDQNRELTIAQFKDGYKASREDQHTPIAEADGLGGGQA